MRLIDADKLSSDMEQVFDNAKGTTALAARLVWAFIEKADTVDNVAQRKGHWTRADADKDYFTCSYCKENNIKGRKAYLPSYASTLKFCPNCGADMREQET